MVEPDDPAAPPSGDDEPAGSDRSKIEREPVGADGLAESGEHLDDRTELEHFIATRMLGRRGDGRHERIGKVTLRLRGGPHADLAVAFTGDRIEGGRGRANDLVLDDSTVSQSHFELVLGRETLCLRDLGSTNGTWLGPVRVREVEIPVGTVFTVGETDIEIAAVERMRVPASRVDEFGPLRGKSPIMRELFVLLERLAATDLDIMLQGEPGTGKRITAEAIHRRSKRSSGPLVICDCGGDRDVAAVEAALFGSPAGAPGALDQAAGGTLVLRRVEDLPIRLQAKLLDLVVARDALRESAGGPSSRDVRFLFLCTLDLRILAAEGLFFERLYEKIAEVPLRIPPLRERTDDLVFLLEHFLVDFSPDRLHGLSEDAQRALALYTFPGNVRELRGIALRALDRASGPQITRRDLSLGSGKDVDGIEGLARLAFRAAKDRFAQRYFSTLDRDAEGRLDEVLRRSRVSVSTLRRMLPHLFRQND